MTDIAGCLPLVMSWIYQRFSRRCPDVRSAFVFPLASRYMSWDALRPAWMLTAEEKMTWRAVVPIVCFMYVWMHHVDRVKRQLGGEQQIPEDRSTWTDFWMSARGEMISGGRRGTRTGTMTGRGGLRMSVR
ncbi:hypothetical protein PIB30_077431 [Stylosanthes scabra]|uniref:Uncharacterized protein n=1 Tax=Stylosanthes scabra TaxID=79078 RepID=A0ABU6SQP8_9FABA|nr:hypothetical protein [Stylosanthes scabra]